MYCCSICGRCFKTKRGLEQHMRRAHPGVYSVDRLIRRGMEGGRGKRRRRKRGFLDLF